MIYEVKKDDVKFEIDDTVFFSNQTKKFQAAFNKNRQGNSCEFDNARIILLDSGRIIVTIKESEDGTI